MAPFLLSRSCKRCYFSMSLISNFNNNNHYNGKIASMCLLKIRNLNVKRFGFGSNTRGFGVLGFGVGGWGFGVLEFRAKGCGVGG